MSFACPKCGKPSKCVDTRTGDFSRKTAGEYFCRRRRECLSKKCRTRFTTAEIVVDTGSGRHAGTALKSFHQRMAKEAVKDIVSGIFEGLTT
jgi:hypothetical protein